MEFNPADPFALFRQFWPNMPTGAPSPFAPPLTEQEIERKLAELHVIKGWLTMNVGMVTMQIKALEMQKAALAALTPKDPSA